MRKILAVVKREYIQIVRTKSFLIGTILGPVLMSLFIAVPILMSVVSVDRQEKIGIIDVSGAVSGELGAQLDQRLKSGEKRWLLEEYPVRGDVDSLKEDLNRLVLEKKLAAYLFIPESVFREGRVEYLSEHVSDFDKTRAIASALNNVVIGKRLRDQGLDPAAVGRLMQRVPLVTKKVTKRGVEEDTGGTFLIAYILVMILYMTLILYGQVILRGVIEEKSSRVVEIVLSSLKPSQLMAGKILGIGAVGLTQYAIWAVFGILLLSHGKVVAARFIPEAAGFAMPSIPASIFGYFILFFILGYFLFSTLFAAVGSTVNSEKEAQQLMSPLIMLLVIPLLLIMFIVRSPNSTVSVILSLIPFFAPILMMLRVCVLMPPVIQIAGSILILLFSIVVMIWLSARIYRVGILMYGKRPSPLEIVKWLRYR